MKRAIINFRQTVSRRLPIAAALLCLLLNNETHMVFAQQQTALANPSSANSSAPSSPSQKQALASAPKQSAAPAPIKLGSLTLSGSLRARLEDWDWFDTQAA